MGKLYRSLLQIEQVVVVADSLAKLLDHEEDPKEHALSPVYDLCHQRYHVVIFSSQVAPRRGCADRQLSA